MLSRLPLRLRNRRYGSRHNPPYRTLDPVALANSMLGLLLVLLVIAMISRQPLYGLAVEEHLLRHVIPMPGALREDAMRVVVTRDGRIYFGNVRVAEEDLPKLIRQRAQNGAEHKVYLVVDPRAPYADLSIVLDGVRRAGMGEIALLAESPFLHK